MARADLLKKLFSSYREDDKELFYAIALRAEEAINIAIKYIKKCQAQADEITALINKNKGVV